jgi:two-component system chemotaxis response regulator CheB
MISVAELYGERAIGVLLTGMGEDGAAGMAAIKEHAGRTVVQDQATSLVFGMPRAAIERDVVDWVVPLQEIPETIINLLSRKD